MFDYRLGGVELGIGIRVPIVNTCIGESIVCLCLRSVVRHEGVIWPPFTIETEMSGMKTRHAWLSCEYFHLQITALKCSPPIHGYRGRRQTEWRRFGISSSWGGNDAVVSSTFIALLLGTQNTKLKLQNRSPTRQAPKSLSEPPRPLAKASTRALQID